MAPVLRNAVFRVDGRAAMGKTAGCEPSILSSPEGDERGDGQFGSGGKLKSSIGGGALGFSFAE